MIDCELYVIESDARTKEEALQQSAKILIDNKCVKKGFYESCLEREKDYPTGLTQSCPVAIPHTSKDYVNKDAICVLKLKESVKFASMENWEEEINVKTIFNLAFLDDSEHLILITKIIRGLKNESFVKSLSELSTDDLKRFLKKELLDIKGEN